MKFAVIHQHRKQYSIQIMCRFFGISRSGYYRYVKNLDRSRKNADMAENFFSILKCECIYQKKPKNLKQAREMIDEYIWFYNNRRYYRRGHWVGMGPVSAVRRGAGTHGKSSFMKK